MDIIFNYNFDPSNGINSIESIAEVKYDIVGEPNFNDNLLGIPIHIRGTDQWKILLYTYDPNEEKISFSQMLDIPDECETALIHVACATDFIVGLNNDTHKCHIYTRGNSTTWEFESSLDVDYSSSTTAEDAGSVRVASNILLVSDWTIDYGFGYVGAVIDYRYSTEGFEEFAGYVLFFGGVKYGYSFDLRACDSYAIVAIGDPLYDMDGILPTNSGIVNFFIIEKNGSTYYSANTYYGANTNDNFGNAVSVYLAPSEEMLIMVGAEGYNSNIGRVYLYSGTLADFEGGGLASAVIDPTAPTPDLHFGNLVSAISLSNIIIYADELATGYLAEYKYSAGWVYATPSYANPYSINGINYLVSFGSYTIYDYNGKLYSLIQYNGSPPDGKIRIQFLNSTIIIKSVYDNSFYTSDLANNFIEISLGFSILGNYRLTMSMPNNIKTIDTHNDTIYYVIYNDWTDVYGYFEVLLDHGNYTEAELATEVASKINGGVPGIGAPYITLTYDATTNKYLAYIDFSGSIEFSRRLYTFGSNSSTASLNSAQDSVMGFYTNDGTILTNSIIADREADLSTPSQIGIIIKEAIPIKPLRSANSSAEVQTIANLSGGNYVIVSDDGQDIRFTKKTSTITFIFKHMLNGAPLNVNTNQLSGRLQAI